MSNKKLLEESTVEKFMKLAKIDASKSKQFLTENFTEGSEDLSAPKNEMEIEEMGAYGSMEEKEHGMDELEMPELEEEVALEELDLFEEEDEDMGELAMSSEEAEQIIDTLEMLLDKLRMAVGAEEEPEMEEPEPTEEEPEPEEEEPEEGEGEEAPEEGEGEDEMELEESQEDLQEAMVNRIAKRVAARLLKEKNNN